MLRISEQTRSNGRKGFMIWNKCLVELTSKVGDSSPIFGIMAGMMENISSITVIGRTTDGWMEEHHRSLQVDVSGGGR
ncbi:unnamed protein product [Lactuca virosa]|uniref:Uncharacterized protein n=1 Tax=Lactuca virosa TaxID=75947 RepID=A0AAU9P4E2_9ASTR|nr:unnamed protein product [Lactuca virosa]